MNKLEKKDELLRMAVYLKNLFEANGIWYCLAFGSMLGAVRHNGFIPWDHDLDFHIKINDVGKVRKLIADNPLEGTFLQIRGKAHCTNSHDGLISKRVEGCGIDIDQLIGVPSNKIKRNIFCYICYFCDMAFRHKHMDINECKEKNKKKVRCVKFLTHFVPDIFIEWIYRKLENRYDYNSSDYIKSLCSVYVPHDCLKRIRIEKRIKHEFENQFFMIPVNYDYYLKRMYGDYMTPKRY